MKWTSNIKAFTILEIVIGLAIISIIISMTYGIYVMLNRQLLEYNSNSEAINFYNELDGHIRRDFYNANKLHFNEESMILLNSFEKVSYEIIDQKMIRIKNSVIDTFPVTVKEFIPSFENELLMKRHKKLQITYEVLGVPIKAVYIKDFGTYDQINNLNLNE